MFEATIDSGTMIARFSGALDTSNAAETQEQLLATIAANKIDSVTLDLSDLNYVSSAGLRVFFKIKQQVPNTQVTGASLAVYEVFDISGLTQLMSVNKTMEEMNVDGCTVILADEWGTRYAVDENVSIKVFIPEVTLEQIEEQIVLMQSAFALGAGNSISFNIGTCGDCLAVKFVHHPGVSFTNALEENADEFDDYMDAFFDAFMHFGQAEYPEDEFDTIQDVLRGRVETLEKYISGDEAAVLYDLVDALKEGYDLIHGDLNPNAFTLIDGELSLDFKTELATGPAIYDVYCLQRYFTYAEDLPKDHIMRTLTLTPALNECVEDAFYERYFECDDDDAIAEKREKIDLASTLEKYLFLATKSEERIEELAETYNDVFLRGILIPRKDEIANLLATL